MLKRLNIIKKVNNIGTDDTSTLVKKVIMAQRLMKLKRNLLLIIIM